MLRCHHLIMVVLCMLASLHATSPDIKNKQTLSAYFDKVRSDWALYLFSKSGLKIEESTPISYVFWGLGPKDTQYEKIPGTAKQYHHHDPSAPQSILRIQPSKTLDPAKIWMLRFESPDGNEENLHYTLENWYPQLITPFTAQPQVAIHSKSRDLSINWNIPVLSKEETRIFRDYIHVESNGVRSQNTADGLSKTICINGKELTFKLDVEKNMDLIAKGDDKDNSNDSMKILIQGEPIFEGHIILKAGIPAQDGQRLKNETSLPVRIGVNNPHFWYLGADYQALHSNIEYPFFASYLSSAKISLQKIKSQEAPVFFLAWKEANQKQLESWKAIQQALANKAPAELNEWRSFMHRPVNTQDVKSEISYNYQWTPSSYKELKNVSLSDISKQKTMVPGLYLLDFLGRPNALSSGEIKRNGYPLDDTHIFPLEGKAVVGSQKIIQVTDIGCLWKQSSKQIFLYLYSLKTGEPLLNSSIRFLDSEGATIKECKASDGTATLEAPKNATLLMFTHKKDQCILNFPNALTFNAPHYIESIDTPTPFPIKRKISFISNRDTLQKDGTFHLKAIMRGSDGKTLQLMPTEKCYINIQNSAGNILKAEEVTWDKYGTLDIDFKIPPHTSVTTHWNDNELPTFKLQKNKGDYTLSLYFPRNGISHKMEEDTPVSQNTTPFATDLEYYERSQRHFEITFNPEKPELTQEQPKIATDKGIEEPLPTSTGNGIDIRTDKKTYATGEKAIVQFAEPISGPVLLSIERDHILTQKVLILAPQTNSIEVPIHQDYFPNAFISIAQIKLGQHPYQLQLDTSEIRVNKPENQLFIKLDNPTISPKGEQTSLQGSIHDHLGKPMPNIQILIQVETLHADTLPLDQDGHTVEQDFYPAQIHRVRTGSTLHILESRIKGFHLKEHHEELTEYAPDENTATLNSKTATTQPVTPTAAQTDSLWLKNVDTNADGHFSASWTSLPNQRYLIHITAISTGAKMGATSKEYTTRSSTPTQADAIPKP